MTTVTRLGPFTRFEKPTALTHVFYEDDGTTALDITSYDVLATWHLKGQSPPADVESFAGTLTTDGSDGSVTIPWGTASPSPFAAAGLVELQIWVENSGGTVRYASEIFRFYVRASVPTTEPTV